MRIHEFYDRLHWVPPLETMQEPSLEVQCATKCQMLDMCLKVTSEIVMRLLLSKHLYVLEPFDMCGFSFGIVIYDMYG